MATITDRVMSSEYDGCRFGGSWNYLINYSYFQYADDSLACWIQFDLNEISQGDIIESATMSIVPVATVEDIGQCRTDTSNRTTQTLVSDPYPDGVVADTDYTFTPATWVQNVRTSINLTTPVQEFVTNNDPGSSYLTLRLQMTEDKIFLPFYSGDNAANLRPTYSIKYTPVPRNVSHTFSHFEANNSYSSFRDF